LNIKQPLKKLYNRHIMLLLFIIIFVFLRLPSLFEPYWYADEGIYLVLGNAIRKGITIYSQIHDNKTPLLYYLAAIGHTVFGFRLLLFLWMIPTIYFFYRLSKNKLVTFIFMVLSCVPLIEGHIANAEVFMLLPTILGILFCLSEKYFWSGLFLGIAFTIKVPVMLEFAFLGFWLLFIQKTKFRNIIKISIGFILPITLWAIYFYLRHAFPQFLVAALLQNFGYLNSWSTAASSGGLKTRAIYLILSYFIIWLLYVKKFIDKNSAFIFFWFAAALFGTLLSSRPYPHYLIQVLPPFCLLIQNFKKTYFTLIPLGILIFAIYSFHFYFYQNISYYKNFYLNHNNPSYFNNNIDSIYKTSAYIKQNTNSADRIFVWGDEPDIYALSDRLPVGKYTVAYHIADFNGYALTVNALKISPPKIIVYIPQPNRPFIQLDEFIERYYLLVQNNGPQLIYKYRQ